MEILIFIIAIVALVVAGRSLRRRLQRDDRAEARHYTLAGAHNLYERIRKSATDYE